MDKHKDLIFDIQKFCIHDGPGIRTTIFLKGCNMHCLWCHNPESFNKGKQLSYNKEKCTNCLSCATVCTTGALTVSNNNLVVNHSLCKGCLKCESVCLNNCLSIIGKEYTLNEVFIEVEKDRKYYEESNGGITVSGGEPSVSPTFLVEILKEAKNRNLHVCLETNGTSSKEFLQQINEYVDIYLFDYKITNNENHKKYTGIERKRVLNSLDYLDSINANIYLRCPIIPTINDTDEHFSAIKSLKEKYKSITNVEIMAYHDIGKDKWERIGKNYTLVDIKTATNEQKELWNSKIL